MINVGERLVYFRKMRGLTTNRLANIAGVSQSHLREIELGKKNPTVETLSYFCDALGVGLSEFFDESDTAANSVLISSVKKLSERQQIKLADFINDIMK